MLEHCGLEPPLGTSQDFVAVGLTFGLDHEIPAGPPIETEQPGFVTRPAVSAGMQPGSDSVLLEHARESTVKRVVEHLGVASPGMPAGHSHGVGKVTAVDDGPAAARPTDERQAGDGGRLPGVGESLESTE